MIAGILILALGLISLGFGLGLILSAWIDRYIAGTRKVEIETAQMMHDFERQTGIFEGDEE